jgi:hypothetical protein
LQRFAQFKRAIMLFNTAFDRLVFANAHPIQ